MEKFKFKFGPGGHVDISWQGIFLSRGRPWIKDPSDKDYSELLIKLWPQEDCWELIEDELDECSQPDWVKPVELTDEELKDVIKEGIKVRKEVEQRCKKMMTPFWAKKPIC